MRRGQWLVTTTCAVSTACSLFLPLDVTGGRTDDDASVQPIADASDSPVEAGAAPDVDADDVCRRRGSVPDLVAYYPLDERSGTTVRDCSGGGHDGQILRVAPTTWVDGKFGGGVRVASPDGCIDFGTPPEFEMKGPFTAMAWVNVRSYPESSTMAIVGKSTSELATGWRVHTAPVSEIGASVAKDGGPLFVGRDPVRTNEWHHAAVVFVPNAEFVLYVDGVRVSERAWPGPLLEDEGSPLRVGCRADNTGFIDGIVDEIRLYARSLTPAEIAELSTP